MRFHYQEFSNLQALLVSKRGHRITVCIPTLNEAATISSIVETIRRELMETVPLVDQLLVIDSDSSDDTRRLAAQAGATVYNSANISPHHGCHPGKGENLWKALHVSTGDIVCYIDGDISNFHPGFVTGLIGPLLQNPHCDFVKAYYDRPLSNGEGSYSSGGGRVSEILIRPLLSLFYPELTTIYQPLAGECAARRDFFEALSFPTGYGIEIAHLIDIAASGKLDRVAQTDLVKRIHRNREDAELGDMAFALLQVILHRLQRDQKLTLHLSIPEIFHSWRFPEGLPALSSKNLPIFERPPMASLLQLL